MAGIGFGYYKWSSCRCTKLKIACSNVKCPLLKTQFWLICNSELWFTHPEPEQHKYLQDTCWEFSCPFLVTPSEPLLLQAPPPASPSSLPFLSCHPKARSRTAEKTCSGNICRKATVVSFLTHESMELSLLPRLLSIVPAPRTTKPGRKALIWGPGLWKKLWNFSFIPVSWKLLRNNYKLRCSSC